MSKQEQPRPKFKWCYGLLKVEANTKSEARAVIKKAMKLKRLPVGAVVRKEEGK